jgi:predicted RNA-binding protein with PIN domain
MHLDSGRAPAGPEQKPAETPAPARTGAAKNKDPFALDKELQAIFEKTYGPIKRRDILPKPPKPERPAQPAPAGGNTRRLHEGPDFLLVDGYNIIYAWDDLSAVARGNMDAARQILMDILSNYKGFRQREVILVFDAYRVPGGQERITRYHNISVVYTKEAETADAYIEKTTYQIGKNHRVSVATSDGAVQLIILGHGALRVTPQALRAEIEQTNADIAAIIEANNRKGAAPSIIFPK